MAKKKKKESEEIPEEIPDVSDETDDIEIVESITDQNLEILLTPEVDNSSVKLIETNNETVGIIVPEDKMTHRKIGMRCNSCFISDTCPQFKEDSECTIEWGRLFKGEFTPSDILQSSAVILDLQLMRILHYMQIG